MLKKCIHRNLERIFVLCIRSKSINFASNIYTTMSLGTSVNKNKNGMLLAYIANSIPDIHLRKLLKIVYLIDEHFMKMRGFPLTWFDYYAWAKGPVAPEVYEIKDGAFSGFVSTYRSADNRRVVNSICNTREIENGIANGFSASEIEIINQLIATYGSHTADELSDLTHMEDSLWSKAVAEHNLRFDKDNTKSDVRIDLRLLLPDCDSRLDTYDTARWDMEFQAKLSSTANPQHKIQLQVVSPSDREQHHIPVYSPEIP